MGCTSSKLVKIKPHKQKKSSAGLRSNSNSRFKINSKISREKRPNVKTTPQTFSQRKMKDPTLRRIPKKKDRLMLEGNCQTPKILLHNFFKKELLKKRRNIDELIDLVNNVEGASVIEGSKISSIQKNMKGKALKYRNNSSTKPNRFQEDSKSNFSNNGNVKEKKTTRKFYGSRRSAFRKKSSSMNFIAKPRHSINLAMIKGYNRLPSMDKNPSPGIIDKINQRSGFNFKSTDQDTYRKFRSSMIGSGWMQGVELKKSSNSQKRVVVVKSKKWRKRKREKNSSSKYKSERLPRNKVDSNFNSERRSRPNLKKKENQRRRKAQKNSQFENQDRSNSKSKKGMKSSKEVNFSKNSVTHVFSVKNSVCSSIKNFKPLSVFGKGILKQPHHKIQDSKEETENMSFKSEFKNQREKKPRLNMSVFERRAKVNKSKSKPNLNMTINYASGSDQHFITRINRNNEGILKNLNNSFTLVKFNSYKKHKKRHTVNQGGLKNFIYTNNNEYEEKLLDENHNMVHQIEEEASNAHADTPQNTKKIFIRDRNREKEAMEDMGSEESSIKGASSGSSSSNMNKSLFKRRQYLTNRLMRNEHKLNERMLAKDEQQDSIDVTREIMSPLIKPGSGSGMNPFKIINKPISRAKTPSVRNKNVNEDVKLRKKLNTSVVGAREIQNFAFSAQQSFHSKNSDGSVLNRKVILVKRTPNVIKSEAQSLHNNESPKKVELVKPIATRKNSISKKELKKSRFHLQSMTPGFGNSKENTSTDNQSPTQREIFNHFTKENLVNKGMQEESFSSENDSLLEKLNIKQESPKKKQPEEKKNRIEIERNLSPRFTKKESDNTKTVNESSYQRNTGTRGNSIIPAMINQTIPTFNNTLNFQNSINMTSNNVVSNTPQYENENEREVNLSNILNGDVQNSKTRPYNLSNVETFMRIKDESMSNTFVTDKLGNNGSSIKHYSTVSNRVSKLRESVFAGKKTGDHKVAERSLNC